MFALQYVSGGETPFGFRVAVFEAGWVELQSAGGKTLRRKLSESELSEAKAVIGDFGLIKALRDASEAATQACCEPEEVLLEVGINREPYRVALEGVEASSEIVRDFFRYVNSLERNHFGSEFSLPIPERK